ncbi:hypothetical protein NGB36_26195 [Streptomyces sp. RB6PN25]|uniref:Uncharacterized protein n=1 Tax=Streptomyces humicola TaxID=2953240 RepID=A0ABT1Q241_9ACTN|nr:hypothetical protein [Streptomyces humicola]MCQ4083982.1 hypothetical protein [Streptomyces humicola]
MQRKPDTAEVGLSTEDLASTQGNTEDTTAPPAEQPTYPGEGTAVEAEPAAPKPQEGGPAAAEEEMPQLLNEHDQETFRSQWKEIQNKFVDDPRDAVHSADALVATVMQSLATTFAEYKQELEGQWNRGEQVSTEDLRTALQQYRSFFNRLLST